MKISMISLVLFLASSVFSACNSKKIEVTSVPVKKDRTTSKVPVKTSSTTTVMPPDVVILSEEYVDARVKIHRWR